jgi:hypothetical protein
MVLELSLAALGIGWLLSDSKLQGVERAWSAASAHFGDEARRHQMAAAAKLQQQAEHHQQTEQHQSQSHSQSQPRDDRKEAEECLV